MNLFGKKKAEPAAPIPSIDEARENVDSMKRGALMRGRAAAMLSSGAMAAPTAQRSVTGN